MQFSKSLLPAITLAAPFAEAWQQSEYTLNVNSSTFNPNFEIQTGIVSYANSSIWIGNINREIYAEPFSVKGLFTFTSFHGVATGEQQLYIFPNETMPVQFTVPHAAGIVPDGATTSGFAFNGCSDGVSDYLTWNGKNHFWGVQNARDAELNSFQIWWFGDGKVDDDLELLGPLHLYADHTCTTND